MKDINWLEEARAYDSLMNPEATTKDCDSDGIAYIGGIQWNAKSVFEVEPNVEQIERDAKYLKEGIQCRSCKKVKMPSSFRKLRNGSYSPNCKRCADKWRATDTGKLQAKLDAHCKRTNDAYIPANRYKATLEHFKHACAKCGSGANLHIDHLQPVAKGGRTVIENLIPLCSACNLAKHDCEPVAFFGEELLAEIKEYLQSRIKSSRGSKK